MSKIFITFFSLLFFNCKNEKSIDSKVDNLIIYDSSEKEKIETVLPEEIDSLNIFFTKNRFDYYILHIDKEEYVLLDLNNNKKYNVNMMQDSIDKYIVDLFIDEKIPIIKKKNVIDDRISTDYNSMSISKYYNNKPNNTYDINFGDEHTEIEFSESFNKFTNILFFITYSPENIEKRIETIERWRESEKRNPRKPELN